MLVTSYKHTKSASLSSIIFNISGYLFSMLNLLNQTLYVSILNFFIFSYYYYYLIKHYLNFYI
jgi:hypothetical protein